MPNMTKCKGHKGKCAIKKFTIHQNKQKLIS